MDDIVQKSVTAEITSVDKDTGTFSAVLSTPDTDREGETIHPNEWKSFPARIPINVDHDMSVSGTIASAVPILNADGQVTIEGTFASTQKAQEVRTLINEGHVSTMSVEFLRKRTPSTEKGGSPTVTRELIGGAFTPYPINPNAKVLSSKAGARNNASDAKNIQGIHDMAGALGAACSGPDGKSLTLGRKADYGDDASSLLEAVDAALDSALELITDYDVTQLPPVIQQFIACVVAADATKDKLVATVGLPDPDETPGFAKSMVGKAIGDKPWSDFSQADYSIEQWRKACVVHPDAPSENKGDYKLPIREPNGDLNSNAVHAAAGRVHELQGASKSQAAKALLTAYGQLKEDPPKDLASLAGVSQSDDSATKSAANAANSVADDEAKLNLLTSSFHAKYLLAQSLLAE